jgi:hypothetical protein
LYPCNSTTTSPISSATPSSIATSLPCNYGVVIPLIFVTLILFATSPTTTITSFVCTYTLLGRLLIFVVSWVWYTNSFSLLFSL